MGGGAGASAQVHLGGLGLGPGERARIFGRGLAGYEPREQDETWVSPTAGGGNALAGVLGGEEYWLSVRRGAW